MIRCSIIIVNYKAAQMVLDCLATIGSNPKLEVIIVDNFSNDDSESIITSSFPHVRWLQMGYNSGFARANNAGIRAASAEVVLLLNPDTLNENNAIETCLDRFLQSGYVACGVQLLNPDRTPQVSGSYVMKGGLNILLVLPYVGSFLKGIAGIFNVKKTSLFDASGVVEVDWINGAYLMVKRKAIDQAGLLDEDFFLYAEEAEWCSRIRKTGKLCIYGDLHVVHLQGPTINKAFNSGGQGYMNIFDRKGFQLLVSNTVRIRKEFGTGWLLFHLLIYWATIPVFFICLLLAKLFRAGRAKYSWKQFAGFSRNIFGLTTYAGKMIRNKPYFYNVLSKN